MSPRILIVDDDPLNLITLEAFLADDGYALHVARDGREACEQVRALQPDLILLDVMMPEMDGFAVCRSIRSDPVIGRVPIIMVTALDDEQSRVEGLRAGADDFLTKPCMREEFRARVRTVISLNRFRTIAEQRTRIQRLFELSTDAIIVTDASGRVLEANPRAEALLAAPHEGPLRGDVVFSRFSLSSATAVRSAIEAAGAEGQQAAVEVRHQAAGEEQILDLRAAGMCENGQHLTLLTFHDVTAEVKAREAAERLNVDLEQLVRARTHELEEANQLLLSYASFVSHDLRSPLTVVKGYLSMIQEGAVPLDADAAPFIDEAYKGTVLMQELLENILQLARDENAGHSRLAAVATDPAPVINRVSLHVRSLFPQLRPQIAIAALPRVGVSPLLIERVFYNLLSNALKFSANTPAPRVEVGTMGQNPPVIFVRDHGVGFDSRDADRLFREFSRLPTGREFGGFGLGLALAARLVRAHGGRIWAESSVGAGATFFVELPSPTCLDEPNDTAELAVGVTA